MPPKDWRKDIEELAGLTDEDINGPAYEADATQDISADKEQLTLLCEQDLNFLAATTVPTIFEFNYPPILLAAWDLLVKLSKEPRSFPQVALGIPRGHGKTTLIKLFVVYLILFSKKRFILILSNTSLNAENILSDVVDMLQERNILTLFGDWRVGREMNRQDLKKFYFRGRPIILAAIGAGGSVRGLNLKNARPDVMVFDDLQTREDANSRPVSEGLEQWMYGTAMKAKAPDGCMFIFAGNMYPTPYSILKKLKTNPTWIKFISGAILANGTALWPELRSLEELIEELNNDIAAGHASIFFAEVLNDTTVGPNSRVDYSQIRMWPWTSGELPQGKYIIIDPSGNKLGSDDVSIGYFEVYDGTPGLRKIISERLSPGNTIKRALLLGLETGTRLIAVESTAYQASLLYWFDFIAEQIGITGFHFVEVYTGNSSKNARITDALKSLTAKEVDVHDEVRSLVLHQISHWNPLKRENEDGILDLLAYARKVMELYGALIATEIDPAMIEAASARVMSDNVCF